MELIERKRAKLLGMTQYFTGKPCGNRHVTFRYVASGACAACITEHCQNSRETTRNTGSAAGRRTIRGQLVELKLRAYPSDLAVLRETAAGACRGRHPELTDRDLASRGNPTDAAGGTALYRVKVHPDDVELLRSVANALLGAHSVVDVATARDRAVHAAVVQAEDVSLADWTEHP